MRSSLLLESAAWLPCTGTDERARSVNQLDKWYVFRQQMVDVLEQDLQGTQEDALIDEPPCDRFILGILHPRSPEAMDDEDNDPGNADGGSAPDEVFDPAIAMARMRYPSSMGLTFAVDKGQTAEIRIDAWAARYAKDEGTEIWHRQEPTIDTTPIAISTPVTRRVEIASGLALYVVVRPAVADIVSVTVVLLNTEVPDPSKRTDPHCWFQPRLRVTVDSGRFIARRSASSSGIEDKDLDSYALLFRDVEDLAVGHGCAAAWDETVDHVTELSTTFLPWYDLKLAESAGGGADLTLPMQTLADGDLSGLEVLLDDYRSWIAEQELRIPGLPLHLQDTARSHMVDASKAADRIAGGVELLRGDELALRAFRLMNEAMGLQRDRQDRQRNVPPQTQSWRPFQIAFILLNLEGLTDPASEDRETADLLWFPTGGGKTEAYLGLIGYTILLRRLHNPAHGGVSVLMRYTLRLLTVQQFERAAGLICALESIRAKEMPAAAGISLGLWVGMGATPNSVKDARAAKKSLERGESSSVGNPRQLLNCPVCGAGLGLDDYRFFTGPDRMVVRCSDATCEYADGLPVYLVDEDVYRVRPSLVIGTVDKFAMMAWRAQVRSLFGRDGQSPPPDLIVQDELHLISGPLGTMVGLYEAAVDAACSGEARPKVVASTATIRRAEEQVRAVFDRDSRQFPPPGLDSTNSYFSVEATAEAKGTRRYLGVMAPSVSHTTLMVRCYAALLQGAQDVPGDDEVRDAYWTLLGYFGSLRVLGGAFMQVHDDVPDRIKVLSHRSGSKEARAIDAVGELTSRKDSTEIPHELDILGTSYPNRLSPDVVLATNMISVGVDVDRLGLMAVMGQPQATAEYIQATSRVGRKYPGLVLVMYNAARSRDMSHYENFGSYHRALYRQVEATGATPFAARARDRGLHGVLVSMARLLIDELSDDDRAVRMPHYRERVMEIVELIVDRARRVSEVEAPRVKDQLVGLVDLWESSCDRPALKYAGWMPPFQNVLLQDPSRALDGEAPTFPVGEPAWPTMTSLRDVDATSGLYLVPATDGKGK